MQHGLFSRFKLIQAKVAEMTYVALWRLVHSAVSDAVGSASDGFLFYAYSSGRDQATA